MDVLRISGSTLRALTIDHNSRLSRRSASALLFAVAINYKELSTFSNCVKVHAGALGLLFSQCCKIQNVKIENRFTTIPIFLKDIRKVELTSNTADLDTLKLLTDGCPQLHTLSCPNLTLTSEEHAEWFKVKCSSLVVLRVGRLSGAALRLVAMKYPNLSVFSAKTASITKSLAEVLQHMPRLHALTLIDNEWPKDSMRSSSSGKLGGEARRCAEDGRGARGLRGAVSSSDNSTSCRSRGSCSSACTSNAVPRPWLTVAGGPARGDPSLRAVECTKYFLGRNLAAVPLGIRRLFLHSCPYINSAHVGCFVNLEELFLQKNENLTDADMLRFARQSPQLRNLTVREFGATTHQAIYGFVDHCAQLVTLQYCCAHLSGGSGEEGSVQGVLLQHFVKRALPGLEHFCSSSRSTAWKWH